MFDLPDLSSFEVNSSTTDRQRAAIERAAASLGVSPIDLAGIISFETAGSFNPSKVGGTGNNYLGLIQFGPSERKQFKVHAGQSFDDQINSVVSYFQTRFKSVGRDTQGASLEDLYTTVIAGNPNANRRKKDSFGTSARSGAARIRREHLPKVIKRFGFTDGMSVVPDLSAFEIPDLSHFELETASAPDAFPPVQTLGGDMVIPGSPDLLNASRQPDRPLLIRNTKPRPTQAVSSEPVIGPEVELPLEQAPRRPVQDNTVLGVASVDASLSPVEQIRQAGTAILSRFGVTPEQVNSWIEDSLKEGGESAVFQGDPSTGQVSISARMLAQIVGPEQAGFLIDTELDRINQEASAVPQITRDEINQIAGWETRLPAFFDEGAGHTSEYLAGVTRLLSPEYLAGTENLKGTVRAYAPNKVYPLLKEHGRLTRSNAEYYNDGSLSTELLRIGGNAISDLPRTVAQMALPGGIVAASAVDMAAQSAGRGDSPDQIRKEAAKGAILGGIAKLAYPVGKGIAQSTGSRLAGGAGAIAFTGAATYPTSRAFGATPEQALKESVYNSVFAVADAAPVLSRAQTLLKRTVTGEPLPDLKAYEAGTQGERGFANEPSTYESTSTATTKSAAPIEAAQKLKNSETDIAAALGSPKARTARNLRANLAEAARSFDQAHEALKDAREVFAKQTPQENFDFIHRFENMLPEDSWDTKPTIKGVIPEGQLEIATTLRKMLDEARDRVRDLGVGSLNRYYENYFPHLFEQPEKVQEFIDKQLSGTKSFMKARKFPTFREALDAGFKPISTNPVDLALTRINDLNRYVAGQKTVKFLRENSYIKQVKNGEPPEGLVKLPDNVAGPDLYAVPGAAKILKTFLSPSLHKYKAFRGYRTFGNFMTQANLSFSLFHLGNVVLDSVTSKLALGIEQLATGHPLRAGRSAVEALVPGYSPIQNIIRGDKLLKEWLTPNSTDPAMSKIAQLLEEAGGRTGLDEFWHTRMSRQFSDHVKQSEYFKAAFKAVPALLDKMSQPVMQYLVPRMKLSAFFDLAQQELERLGPDANPEMIREAMQRSWDSVENRLGEATMDNYFWNNTVKNLGMASFQSLGWQLGAVREFGGAVKDTVTAPKRLVKAVKGEKQALPVVTHRMAYVPAVVMSTGLYGALIQYLLTGEPPETVRDLFFPRNGRKDEKGYPARVNLPTFLKDVYAVSNAPFSTVSHKLHPLPRLMTQLATNQDYFSNEIRNPGEPAMQQLEDVGKHAGSSFLPYSVKGAQQNLKRGAGTRDTILPFIGIAPAPKSINDPWTPGENIIRDFNRQLLGPRKLISSLKDQYIEEVKAGKDVQREMALAVKAGLLTPQDVAEINKTVKQNRLQL